LDLDLLDGDKLGRVRSKVAEVNVGIGTLSELLTWERLAELRNVGAFNL